MTADRWSLAEVVDACAEYGVQWIGPWRHKLEDVEEARRRIDAAGLKVSSLCRGGFFAAEGADEDNRLAVEQAAALGTDVLVLVCGPPASRDLAAARATIEAGIERLLPHAREHGVGGG
jgi:sugar phosphate isomerase/epimerase